MAVRACGYLEGSGGSCWGGLGRREVRGTRQHQPSPGGSCPGDGTGGAGLWPAGTGPPAQYAVCLWCLVWSRPSREAGVCWSTGSELLKAHLVSRRAPGRASGSEPLTARGEAGFAEWPSSEWEGGLGPGGEGPTCRPCSQPRLGPHPSHVPPHPHDIFKLCPAHSEAEGPAAKGGGGAPEAGRPACGFSPPPSGAGSPSPSRRRRRRGPGRSACSIHIVPGFSPAALLPAGHLPPC